MNSRAIEFKINFSQAFQKILREKYNIRYLKHKKIGKYIADFLRILFLKETGYKNIIALIRSH